MAKSYAEKLRSPKWQKRRLQILERDNWKCVICKNSELELHVHHDSYTPNTEPWDYPDDILHTLCKDCHEFITLEPYIKENKVNVLDIKVMASINEVCVYLFFIKGMVFISVRTNTERFTARLGKENIDCFMQYLVYTEMVESYKLK